MKKNVWGIKRWEEIEQLRQKKLWVDGNTELHEAGSESRQKILTGSWKEEEV